MAVDSMTSDDDVRRTVSSSNSSSVDTTLTGLRPDASYNISVAVSLSFGLGPPVSVIATTAREFVVSSTKGEYLIALYTN